MTYLEIYERALWDLEHNNITLGEFEERVKPLEEEVRQTGHWIVDLQDIIGGFYKCSECGRLIYLYGEDNLLEKYPYCHCGAKMEGE